MERPRVGADNPRVLLLRPDHIGDVVLTSAAVQLLLESVPRAHFTYLVGPWSVDAARCGRERIRIKQVALDKFDTIFVQVSGTRPITHEGAHPIAALS